MKIVIENSQKDLSIDEDAVRKLISFTMNELGLHGDEISFLFVSDPQMCEMHEEHFGDPSSTDCMTFPIDQDDDDPSGYRHLGECVICPKAAIEFTSSNSPYRELSLYIVHTLLHIKGYNDLEESDIKIMRAQESLFMEKLEKQGLMLQ